MYSSYLVDRHDQFVVVLSELCFML